MYCVGSIRMMSPTVPRVALVDTYSDEKAEAIMAAEAMKDLYAVRLDTPASRRGSMPDLIREVRWELDAPSVDIGIMIEVPSAVMMADELAQQVDFFSIGTNDLTQYTLAMDRGHPMLAKQADGLHPAVLRMIDRTVQAATAGGKWVGVCGGMAGDPKGAVLLTGLGVTELSMSIPSIAAIKAQLRLLSLKKCRIWQIS